jgi:glycosyltransferase involved in cell wall biosynthesis
MESRTPRSGCLALNYAPWSGRHPPVLNLFYEEPDFDRWIVLDRYPRRIVRRIMRGRPRPGGQTRVFLNLCAGLGRLGIGYRVNDYRYAKWNPASLACIIGRPFVLDKIAWKNPILLGAAIYSHPLDDPHLRERLPVKKILVPGPWMRDMCVPYWGDFVEAWPVGIDTLSWVPTRDTEKTIDVLLYDKVRWKHEHYDQVLLCPIRAALQKRGLSAREIRYGFYREEEFRAALAQCKTMVFVCEHETQGIAYQQALSCGVPIFAWDRQGPWQDPSYFPHRVIFEPVTSVPYWDERCGLRFVDAVDFDTNWDNFWDGARQGRYRPRDFILENLTLERCAQHYMDVARSLGE